MTKTELNKKIATLLKQGDSRVEKLLSGYERKLLKEYQLALDEIKKSIAKIYEKFGDSVKYSDLASYNRLTNLEKQIAEEIKKLTNQNIKTTESALKEIYANSYYNTGFALESAVGVKLGFGQLDTKQIAAALINPLDAIKWPERMKQHAQLYTNQIKSELTQGLIQGKGYARIAKSITEKTGMNAGKVLRIVRTEGHRVQSAGSVVGYETAEKAAGSLGLNTSRVWIATLDERTRRSHARMDGKAAKFVNGVFVWTLPSGVETQGPGLSGIAEEDINCRCTTIMQIEEIPQKFRKDNTNKNIISYATFDEWMTGRMRG